MDDTGWMRHALSLAGQALGQVWPSPAVGCALVRDGMLVGQGWTRTGGRPHAETEALADAGDRARGATAYVTLEPCAHTGQTGPCAVALVEAGIGRAVIAATDPDPRVGGRGIAILKEAGIPVTEGILAAEARALNAGFFSRVERGRPTVTLKLASTLDGRIATGAGESRWITGPDARRYVHHLRAIHDAVMIGAGTARADDPMLDIRDVTAPHRLPVRIVVDASLSLPLTGRLARTASAQPLWLLARAGSDPARRDAFQTLGAEIHDVPTLATGRIDIVAALQTLGAAGLTRILCEGGGLLSASLLKAGLVDELIVISAGKIIGAEGVPNVGNLSLGKLADAPGFEVIETRALGPDIMTRWKPA